LSARYSGLPRRADFSLLAEAPALAVAGAHEKGGVSSLEASLSKPAKPNDGDKRAASIWRRHNSVFNVWSVESPENLKKAMPEVLTGLPMISVMGRSNSGKSTLLNSGKSFQRLCLITEAAPH
jgi:predicted GTPase